MAEKLASRVGRIVSGSLHALVSAFEEAAPETVMEQAIREVDAAVDDVRAELGRVLARKHLASTRLMEENRRHEDMGEKIELALAEKREDLAEAAVARQLDIEAQIPVLERTLAECGEEEKELEGFVRALQGRKREMREELRSFRDAQSKPQRPGVPAPGRAAHDVESRVERATSAFERVIESRAGLPPAAGDLEGAKRLAELEDLARRNRIQERLAQARSHLAKKGGQ